MRPAVAAHESVFDGLEADTAVDARTLPSDSGLPADEEATTAHMPREVEEMLVGISKIAGDDDTATEPTVKKR